MFAFLSWSGKLGRPLWYGNAVLITSLSFLRRHATIVRVAPRYWVISFKNRSCGTCNAIVMDSAQWLAIWTETTSFPHLVHGVQNAARAKYHRRLCAQTPLALTFVLEQNTTASFLNHAAHFCTDTPVGRVHALTESCFLDLHMPRKRKLASTENTMICDGLRRQIFCLTSFNPEWCMLSTYLFSTRFAIKIEWLIHFASGGKRTLGTKVEVNPVKTKTCPRLV